MVVTVRQITELREQTGAGIMSCKAALLETEGDVDKAIVVLRKKGLAAIKTRDGKATNEGMVGYYIHAGGKIGVLVEVNCETDFVAKSEGFQKFSKELAMHIAAANPQWVSRDDVPQLVIDREKEIIADTLKDKPANAIDKITEGKLNKFYRETCLLDQLFIKDPNITISDLLGALVSEVGEKIVVKRFVRFVTGE